MSEETKVSNETEVDSGTENVTQEPAQNEYIAESKKYRKRAQEAESKPQKVNVSAKRLHISASAKRLLDPIISQSA